MDWVGSACGFLAQGALCAAVQSRDLCTSLLAGGDPQSSSRCSRPVSLAQPKRPESCELVPKGLAEPHARISDSCRSADRLTARRARVWTAADHSSRIVCCRLSRNHISDMKTLPAPKAVRGTPAARRCAARATDSKTEEGKRSAKDVRVGFKWNPATSKWMKDDKLEGKVDAPVLIQPKTGAAYTVRDHL